MAIDDAKSNERGAAEQGKTSEDQRETREVRQAPEVVHNESVRSLGRNHLCSSPLQLAGPDTASSEGVD